MRKTKYETSCEEAWKIFDESDYATLSMCRKDGTPYAVQLSCVRSGYDLYFHCAQEGEKIEVMSENSAVFVSAVKTYEIVEDCYTVHYSSVHMEGIVEEVLDEDEKKLALHIICQRFAPSKEADFERTILKGLPATAIYKIRVHHITGKKKY